MFFIIPKNKRILVFYILVILAGILVEYLKIMPTVKFVGIIILIGILFFVVRTILFGNCSSNCNKKDDD